MAASPVICGQPTRVNPLGSPAPTGPSLDNTKDPNQKVLKTKDINVLKRWREALHIRYKHLLAKYSDDFDIIWRDLDTNNKELTLRDLRSGRTGQSGAVICSGQTWQHQLHYGGGSL